MPPIHPIVMTRISFGFSIGSVIRSRVSSNRLLYVLAHRILFWFHPRIATDDPALIRTRPKQTGVRNVPYSFLLKSEIRQEKKGIQENLKQNEDDIFDHQAPRIDGYDVFLQNQLAYRISDNHDDHKEQSQKQH